MLLYAQSSVSCFKQHKFVNIVCIAEMWDGRNVSSAAHSQAAISESTHNHSGSTQSVSSALTCQLSCNVKAALQTVIFGSSAELVS